VVSNLTDLKLKNTIMNWRKEFEKETGQKIEVTRTFETKVYETEVQIDVWNDDYIFWLQEKLVKLLTTPAVSKCVDAEREDLLIAFYKYVDDEWALGSLTSDVDRVITGFNKSN